MSAPALSSAARQLLDKVERRDARFAVVGMGYVGLPLAVVFAEAGLDVVGVDVSAERMAELNRGKSYIEDIPNERLAPLVASGKLRGTSNFGVLAEADAISICVPTPLGKTRDPDMSFIAAATEQVAQHLRSGQVIVLESTTYPGTTREVIQPELET
ncbi:MAG: NAD(P)-binding domain-containing protein, partial [Bacteroidota bacterium]